MTNPKRIPISLLAAVTSIGLLATLGAETAHAAPAASIKQCDTVLPAKPTAPKPDDPNATAVFPTLKCKVGTGATGLKPADFTWKFQEGDKPTMIQGTKVEPFKDSDEELDIFILVQGTVRFMGDPTPEVAPGEEATPLIGYYEQVKQAIDIIAKARPKHTKVGLYIYGESVKPKVPMGPSENVSAESLGAQKDYSRISTKALKVGLQVAKTTLDNETGRRVLFIIGDGGDQSDTYNPQDEVKKLADSSIEVYILGADPHTMDPRNAARFAKLGKLGRYESAGQADQIPDIANTLANEINNVYTVDFPGSDPTTGAVMPWDGDEHDFTIVAKKDETDPKTYKFLNITPVCPVKGATWDKVTKQCVGGEKPGSLLWLWITLGAVGALAIGVVGFILLRKKPEVEEEEEEAPAPVAAAPMAAPAPSAPAKTMMINMGGGEDSMPVVGWVVPLTGDSQYKTFKLIQGKSVIGTTPDCTVAVNDPFMSTKHAEIAMNPQGFILMDAGSTNGVLVNSKRVTQHELVDNDVFTCGKTDFKFKSIN